MDLRSFQNGVAYIKVFVGMLRDISREDTVEYVLAMIDEMLSGSFELTSDAQL
jgi:V-type H+-transporting ATPase subunit H